MEKGTYTYEPALVLNQGKDRMRFELGDTMVEGGSDTCALTDEEIQAAIDMYPDYWKRAKLALLESIYRRFSYEVDLKEGPLSFDLLERAKLWKQEYEDLKEEIDLESATVPPIPSARKREPPYFHTGMMHNRRAGGRKR